MLIAGLGVAGSPPAYAAELSPCVVPDNGRPQIHQVHLTPAAVDVTAAAQEVTLRMRVADVGGPGAPSGIRSVTADVGPDVVGARGGSRVELQEDQGGWWQGTFTVLPGATSGVWRVKDAEVIDHAGNVLHDPDDIGHDFLLPHDDRTVDVTATPDDEPPQVTSLDLSPRKINTRSKARRIEVRVGAVDNLSGVRSVQVTEGIGNHQQYVRGSIDRFGDRGFRVVAPKVAEDRAAPRLVWRKVRPRTIDIRDDAERVRVRARLRDGGSGVRSASVHLLGQSADMRRVRGTVRDGVWLARFDVGPCARFETTRGGFLIRDKAGNPLHAPFTAHVKVKMRDNVPPRPTHYDNRLDVGEPLTFRFSEAVAGIHDGSVVVQPKRWPDPLGSPVAGSWTCRDGAGDDTSCADGRVRQVSWTPDEPLSENTYRVAINPDGVLDVTDRRGNPVERDAAEPEDFFEFMLVR